MTGPRSSLYAGKVRHTRSRPFHHDFEYRVFYMLLDIDELDDLDGSLRLFSTGRFNLMGFDPSDHGPADGGDLREWVESRLSEAAVDLDGGRIMLLAFPQVLGYAFNPISVWYCYGSDQELRAVIHEVRNTFGDRHSYVVPVASEGLRHSFGKQMHVSPFNGMDQQYQFTLTPPEERLVVSIRQTDEDGEFLRAGMNLTKLALSDRNLLKLFVTHPLLTLKVVGGIHYQALRLWVKGATFHHRPEPPSHLVTVVGDGSYVS